MADNLQFSIAVHLLAALGYMGGHEITSRELASSVNTNSSFVRRVLAKLSKAQLIVTAKGKTGSCWLSRKPEKISLLEIYQAVEAPAAFAIHHYLEQTSCPVSKNIKTSLNHALQKVQSSLEKSLGKISLAEIISDLKRG